jgi:aromatic ring-opening dioxygenase catalytic subunit (LigB family)
MSTTMLKQPAIFLPHGGGPCFFMDWSWGPADTWKLTERFLRELPATLPARPRAILVLSGHWEERAFTVSTAQHPELIYDYYGFPEHTYHLSWPAPGSPEVAARVEQLLRAAGLPVAQAQRGYDHGVFVPLKVAFPEAEIPVVTLSLAVGADGRFDPAQHLAAGRALAPLREEGVLILGSGMSFHNLRAYLAPRTPDLARQFDSWLTEAVELPASQRQERLEQWETAPAARFAHPREEHLIPLMVAAGAGSETPGQRIFHDEPLGAALSAYRFD